MRVLRALLYLAVGLLLGVNISLATAETIAATATTSAVDPYYTGATCTQTFYNLCGLTPQDAQNCVDTGGTQWKTLPWGGTMPAPWTKLGNCGGGAQAAIWKRVGATPACSGGAVLSNDSCVTYTCPTTGNWTLSGSTCTRDDCPAGQTRSTSGACILMPNCIGLQTWTEADPVCRCNATSFNAQAHGEAWIEGTGSLADASTGCADGCKFNLGFGLGGGGKWSAVRGSMTGETCGGTTAVPAKDPIPNHPPKCAAGEGVLTSTSGTVACVPSGTPDARVPAVEVAKKVETFPDNSTKTTETATTTDPLTGVKTVSVSITSTGGQSGTAGTSTSSESTGTGATGTGDGSGAGDGDCDPRKDFCGGPGTGGLYEGKGKTMQSVMQSFKDGVSGSPIGQAATSFLTVTTPGGGCPHWVASVAWFNWSLDIGQYFCTAEAISALNLFGVVLFAVVSFLAFKWAIL